LLFVFGKRYGQIPATLTGFGVGLIQDFLTSGIIGFFSLTKSITGFITGTIGKKKKQLNFKLYIMLLAMVSIIHDVIFYFINTIGSDVSFLKLFFCYSVSSTCYTLLLGVIAYYIRIH